MTLQLPPLALDERPSGDRRRKPRGPQSDFLRARKVENRYGALLRKIARHIGDIVSGFDPNDFIAMSQARAALHRYAETITPWARSVAERMVTEVAARDAQAWRKASADIGKGIAAEIETAPIGGVLRKLMDEQVTLIKSLPLDAADRVHKLAIEGLSEGTRASEIAKEIMRSGEVSRSKANLIARTETGRAQTTLTQVRAEHIGSTGYIWRTAHDSDVRPSHKAMAGKFVAWGEPPELDGMTGHAGALPNCRCYAEPVIPDDD